MSANLIELSRSLESAANELQCGLSGIPEEAIASVTSFIGVCNKFSELLIGGGDYLAIADGLNKFSYLVNSDVRILPDLLISLNHPGASIASAALGDIFDALEFSINYRFLKGLNNKGFNAFVCGEKL